METPSQSHVRFDVNSEQRAGRVPMTALPPLFTLQAWRAEANKCTSA